jgi:pimeloyl-ACP methyl ester carboxylesterase
VRARLFVRVAIVGLIVAGILAGVALRAGWRPQRPVAHAVRVGPVVEEPCVGIRPSQARCYRLSVPENRANPSRDISLRIAVLKATSATRVPDPIFYLAGGPGQAATSVMTARELVDASLGENRDLVFADQRGTGGSNDLSCQFYGPPENPSSYFQQFLPLDKVKACRAALEPVADLTQYTTEASVEDLDAIRTAFGFKQINLVGGSYGTRLAMEYVRRYGPAGRVRAVVLESPVSPADHTPENFGQFAARALDGVFDECAATPACADAFPQMRDEATAVFERLRAGPVTTTALHPSRATRGTVTLTRNHVAEAIRYMLYSSAGASMVPLYLHEAYNGNFAPIADFLIRWRADGTFDGLYLSITCAEDVPFVAADAADRDEPTFLGSYRVREQRAACAEWPHATRPPVAGQPVTSDVPTLITSGALDPVTPSTNAEVIARTLSHSAHVQIPFSGHTAAGLSGLSCLNTMKRTFIDRASTDGLDTTCVSQIERPGFGVSGSR